MREGLRKTKNLERLGSGRNEAQGVRKGVPGGGGTPGVPSSSTEFPLVMHVVEEKKKPTEITLLRGGEGTSASDLRAVAFATKQITQERSHEVEDGRK